MSCLLLLWSPVICESAKKSPRSRTKSVHSDGRQSRSTDECFFYARGRRGGGGSGGAVDVGDMQDEVCVCCEDVAAPRHLADLEWTVRILITHGRGWGRWESDEGGRWRGVAVLQPRVVTLHLGREVPPSYRRGC